MERYERQLKDKVKQRLEKARERIGLGWIKGKSAVDDQGNLVPGWHSTACAWCASGAVYTKMFDDIKVLKGCITALEAELPEEYEAIEDYNDAPTTYISDIITLFDAALERLEKEDS